MAHVEGAEFGSQDTDTPEGASIGRVLWRRKWLVAVIALIGVGLGYLHFSRVLPTYSSTARVMVIRDVPKSLPITGVGASSLVDGIANQALLVRSPLIVGSAVKFHNLSDLSSLSKDETACEEQIIRGLSIRVVEEGAMMLDITYTGGDPHDCQLVANAVAQSYEKFLGDTRQSLGKETVELIGQAKDALLEQLAQKESAFSEWQHTSRLVRKGKDSSINVHADRLTQIESARSQLLIERTQTSAQLRAIEMAMKQGGSREALSLMLDKVQAGTGTQTKSVASELFPMLLEEQLLLENLGSDHPKVRGIQKRIAITRAFLTNTAGPTGDNNPVTAGASKDFVSVYLESLRQELQTNTEKESELNKLFAKEETEARKLSVDESDDERFRNDIQRTQSLFDVVVKRLQEVSLIQDGGGYRIQIISPAPFGWRTGPDFLKTIILGAFCGIFSGLALSYLLEVADKSFRNSLDISKSLGLRVIGHVPPIRIETSENQTIDGSLCTHLRPRSVTAEAFRGVRNALFFCTNGERHKVIQITSADPSDGKSTLAANLAVVIAQSGKRVLLLDADLRRPRVHKLFGVDNDHGLSSLMTSDIDLVDVTQECGLNNLSLLTSGPRPVNPSELLSQPRFAELLEALKAKFDYVIVDTPPLLAVSDPAAVAARVDGVIIAMRIRKNGRQNSIEATDMLKAIGAPVIGIVVNGISAKAGGSYNYGAYSVDGYKYAYGRNGYGGYYEDDETANMPSEIGGISSR